MSNLAATASNDPFTLAYCGLWDMLEDHKGFVGLVSPPNRIKFLAEKLDPSKKTLTDTDLPEVCVEPDGGDPHLQCNSSRTTLTAKFKVFAATGNQRLDTLGPAGINGAIYPVLWETLRAMLGWVTVLKPLTWPTGTDPDTHLPLGNPFIHLAKPTGISISLTDVNQNRQIIGWSATIAYEVHMNFLTAAMAPVSL